MTGSVSGAQLRAFIERIERLEEEKRTIADDIKEVKAEAKGCGFDLPTINAILKLRKKDAAERDEAQAMLDLYMSALGMLPLLESEAVPSYSQSGLSYSEAKGRGDAVGKTDATPFDPETGELTDNQESEPCLGHATEHSAYVGTAPDENPAQDDVGATASSTNSNQGGGNGPALPVDASTDKQAAGASRPTLFNSQASSSQPANSAGEAPSSSPASPARHSDDIDLTIPAFLRRDEGRGYPKRESVEA